MGRKLKRVALDFDWPLTKVWAGFLNPHYKKCETCDGSGETVAAQRLSDLVSLLMLSGSDAASPKQACHPYFSEMPLYHTRGLVCGPEMAKLTAGLAGRRADLFGHDSLDQWSAEKKIVAAAGMPTTWGQCSACQGDGIDPAKKAEYEAWTEMDPPKGDGYQIWETVSEGSPISPVFATPEELARWMADNDRDGLSSDQWLTFIVGPGWAPSLVIDAHGVRSGVSAVVSQIEEVLS